MLVEGKGDQLFANVAPRQELTHHHFRINDFHEHSAAARQIMFDERVVGALSAIFDAPPVAMQSLLFEFGSEQRIHQDFPYVSAQIPSHLVGCWIALEDVDEDNGPLFYLPGSHRVPCFDWGGGKLIFSGRDESQVAAFEDYLEQTCAAAGLERITLHAKKGDVLLWHAALAHGGSPVHDAERTRKSFVIHFSTREAYPRDRRWPHREPQIEEIGGGLLYLRPPGAKAERGLLRRVAGRLRRVLRG